ncbi:MAG: EAL domain-containing protein [Gammaproteobacteria bacterium]|nr:EAL domain-containing protein [Gammaproteobacteria bacterium]NVK86733.1 EAL domain-containing protein [Gammaproteobacteria bacterium]
MNPKRTFRWLKRLIVASALLGLGALQSAQPQRIVRMGGAPMPPLVFVDHEGEVAGIIPQLVDEMAAEHNWQVEWIIDSWANQLDRLDRGEIDIMSAIGYSEKRAFSFDFSSQSVLSVWGQVYTHPSFKMANFLQVDGRTVGVLNNGISGLRFIELCNRFGVNCLIRHYDSYDEVFAAIENGEVMAGVVNSHYGFVVESKFNVSRSDVMFNPFPVLFASRKGQNADLLGQIDVSLRAWKSDDQSIYYQIANSWTRQDNQAFPQWLEYTLYGLSGVVTFALLLVFVLRREVNRQTRQLELSEAQLKQIIDIVPHAIFASDASGKIVLANLESTRVFNRTFKELNTLTRTEIMQQQPYLETLLSEDEKIMGLQQREYSHETKIELPDGQVSYYQLAKVPFIRKRSNTPAVVSVAIDITEERFASEQMEHMARHDDLTGLPNRTFLVDRLEQSLLLAKRHKRYGAVIFVDLDLFKNINDTLGHTVGDALLQATALRLKKYCRESDTVSRFGGDEFVILLTEIGDSYEQAKLNAKNICEKIRAEVIKEVSIGGHELSISISQGLVFFPFDAENTEQIIKRADLAMYHAKLLGRNKIVTFHPSMEQRINRKEKIKTELKQALKNDQLSVVYQPQFNVKTNSFEGAEALLRWRHPVEDSITPMEFIPLAEETDTIIALGEYVIREACMQLDRWRKMVENRFYITVNLSARQIAYENLVPFIDNILAKTAFDYSQLELEVTESLLMVDMDRAVKVLRKLKDKGIRISLDDFGTGYSSLSYLKKLPLDKLKIDKSFVNDIPGDHDSETIARTIISMASELGLEVVAEGVETKEQVDFFCEQGCYLFQGYYFSEPCDSAELNRRFFSVIKNNRKFN